jgi:hypothetical protein
MLSEAGEQQSNFTFPIDRNPVAVNLGSDPPPRQHRTPNASEGSLGPSLGDGAFVQLVEPWGTTRRYRIAESMKSG